MWPWCDPLKSLAVCCHNIWDNTSYGSSQLLYRLCSGSVDHRCTQYSVVDIIDFEVFSFQFYLNFLGLWSFFHFILDFSKLWIRSKVIWYQRMMFRILFVSAFLLITTFSRTVLEGNLSLTKFLVLWFFYMKIINSKY